MFKKLIALGVAVIMLFTLAGCNDSGLELGFLEHKAESYDSWPVTCAVKTETTEFKADNVELDFYYGYYDYESLVNRDPLSFGADWEFIGFAIYFSNADVEIYYSDIYDYRKIEGLWFVKDIPLEEFVDNCAVSLSDSPAKHRLFGKDLYEVTYNRFETLEVPEDVLIGKKGYIGLWLRAILYDFETERYEFNNTGALIYIRYKHIRAESVKISEARSNVRQKHRFDEYE